MKKVWFVLLVMVSLASCRSVQYVPVERVRVDSVYNVVERWDSVRVVDSVYIREKGDTVIAYKYKYIFKEVRSTDTLYITRIDTLTQVVEVEKQLTRGERMRMELGGVLLWLLILGVIYILWRYGKKVFWH